MTDTMTLPGLSDEDLLKRAVANARVMRGRTCYHERWIGVSDVFALGYTYSKQLCRRFGFNPDELVKR